MVYVIFCTLGSMDILGVVFGVPALPPSRNPKGPEDIQGIALPPGLRSRRSSALPFHLHTQVWRLRLIHSPPLQPRQ